MLLLLGFSLSAAESDTLDVANILLEYRDTYQRVSNLQRSTLHWGKDVIIFLSRDGARYRDNVRRGIAERAGEEVDAFSAYAPGTVVVKEQHAPGNPTPDGWSMMVRLVTPAAIGGPWRYIEVGADKRVLVDGTGSDPQARGRCAVCHQQIGARDFLFHSFADLQPTPAMDGTP